ncbi:MAG: outer membrane beta-barrel protein [Xanthobacteraceae bacterium]|nr:outer membrane beta-barrel protein [Xanthobacteraceae bacterium]
MTINSTEAQALGTITARLGLAFDRTLFYLKGGGAWVHNKYSALDVDPTRVTFNRVVATADETRWGWVAGAGIEQMLWDNWSAHVEYQYIRLGRRVLAMDTDPAFSPGVVEGFRQHINLIKVGLNYRFWSWR